MAVISGLAYRSLGSFPKILMQYWFDSNFLKNGPTVNWYVVLIHQPRLYVPILYLYILWPCLKTGNLGSV